MKLNLVKARQAHGLENLSAQKRLGIVQRILTKTRARLAPYTWFEIEQAKILRKERAALQERLIIKRQAQKASNIKQRLERKNRESLRESGFLWSATDLIPGEPHSDHDDEAELKQPGIRDIAALERLKACYAEELEGVKSRHEQELGELKKLPFCPEKLSRHTRNFAREYAGVVREYMRMRNALQEELEDRREAQTVDDRASDTVNPELWEDDDEAEKLRQLEILYAKEIKMPAGDSAVELRQRYAGVIASCERAEGERKIQGLLARNDREADLERIVARIEGATRNTWTDIQERLEGSGQRDLRRKRWT